MSLLATSIDLAERAPLPDAALKMGVSALVEGARRRIVRQNDPQEEAFAADMVRHPIAEHADAANSQHYELPEAFFGLVLGPRRKYSSCLYTPAATTLAQAEDLAQKKSGEAAIPGGM